MTLLIIIQTIALLISLAMAIHYANKNEVSWTIIMCTLIIVSTLSILQY
jgi:hypothetical protein